MNKIYLLSGIDDLMCVNVKLNKELSEQITLRGDYLPNIENIERIIDYYNDCVRDGLNGDYAKDRVYGKRILLGNLTDLFGTEREEEALNILSMLDFGSREEISLKKLRDDTLSNAKEAYELYGEKELIYSMIDYRDLLTSSLDRVFEEYKIESIQNAKVLSMAYMRSAKKSKEI